MKNAVYASLFVLASTLFAFGQSSSTISVPQNGVVTAGPVVLGVTETASANERREPKSIGSPVTTEGMVMVPMEYLITLTNTLTSMQNELSEIRAKVDSNENLMNGFVVQTDSLRRYLEKVLGSEAGPNIIDGNNPCSSRMILDPYPNHPILCILKKIGSR